MELAVDQPVVQGTANVPDAAKGIGGVLGYVTSKWLLACIAMALLLDRGLHRSSFLSAGQSEGPGHSRTPSVPAGSSCAVPALAGHHLTLCQ